PADRTVPAGDEATFALIPIYFPEEDKDDAPLDVGDIWLTTTAALPAAGNSVAYGFPLMDAPSDEYFQYVGDPDDTNSDEEAAIFMVAAFVDSNGDEDYDEGEPLLGSDMTMLGYLRGDGGMADSMGFEVDQWNLFDMKFEEGGEPENVIPISPDEGTDQWHLESNLLPAAIDELKVTIVPDFGTDINITLYSFTADPNQYGPQDVQVATTAGVDTTGGNTVDYLGLEEPDEYHFTTDMGGDDSPDSNDKPPMPMEMAAFVVFAYDDLNGSGYMEFDPYNPSNGDVPYGSSNDSTQPRMVMYLRPLDLTAGIWLSMTGMNPGWMLMEGGEKDENDNKDDGPPPVIDWDEGVFVDRFQDKDDN
ncbi:MAG: hypothetical protein HN348_14560, partial [Proteobacteria bacterium]|nr:hypothetical protein [Pseudomonadota bacterium]